MLDGAKVYNDHAGKETGVKRQNQIWDGEAQKM